MAAGLTIPTEVREVIGKLQAAGFEAYAVGGCVRDLLLGRKPGDWDVATRATPEEIQALFPDSFYANQFLTVTVKIPRPPQAAGTPAGGLGAGAEDPTLREVEVTTFRAEGQYRDRRHPEAVRPAETLAEDLGRRDFTVNAMALRLASGGAVAETIDPSGGQADLAARIIRAVGEAKERFGEDALRTLRAVRLAAELGFAIEPRTAAAIRQNAGGLQAISKERIRDEFSKTLMAAEPHRPVPTGRLAEAFGLPLDTPQAAEAPRSERAAAIGGGAAWTAMERLHELGLLQHIVPELEEGVGVTQNKHHVYTAWEHNLRSLDFACRERFGLAVRLGALLHDVAKPRAKRGEGPDATFYGHDVLGAKMTYQILTRLRYPEVFTERVAKLVRWHLFRYDYEGDPVQTTDSAIRRLIRNVGEENTRDLVQVRMCDRVGSGVPKAVPYRLRHFQFRVEKVLHEHEAVRVTMLQVRGDDVMRILGVGPGPTVGHVLNALLEEVLDDPAKNERAYLESRVAELGALADAELVQLREKAETRLELLEDQREQEIKKKYYVK